MIYTVGKVRPKKFNVPLTHNVSAHSYGNETLQLLGIGKFVSCMGIGVVDKIIKGDKFDIVKMRFSPFTNAVNVVCKESTPRKQIFTLKAQHYAQVVGTYGAVKVKTKNGNYVWKRVIYARALQGWITPNAYDRKHFDTINEFIEMTQEESEETKDILSNFIKNE